jgi:ABC-type Mn2+/Zn2+ transport system permease subunit
MVAVAVAAAALSPLIVARRWAFIGEGVSHGGFGGAGLIWFTAVLLPGVELLRTAWASSLGVAIGCFGVALVVSRMTRPGGRRGPEVGFDASVAIVLTASLAIGFLARSIFAERFGILPPRADTLLFGATGAVSWAEMVAAVVIASAVIAGLLLRSRDVLTYAMDPKLAELAGVSAGRVHLGLLLAVAATMTAGARLIGAVLVVALLVIPGATAARLAVTLRGTWLVSTLVATASVLGAAGWAYGLSKLGWIVPAGPLVVLLLAAMFVAAGVVRFGRRTT